MTVELKPCPICGEVLDIGSEAMMGYSLHCKCGLTFGYFKKSDDLIAAWNRRAPELGTSVIRWTRYDGTAETLSDEGRIILVSPKAIKLIIPVFAVVYNGTFMLNITTPADSEAHIIEKKSEIGDLWAYLPEPPEGME